MKGLLLRTAFKRLGLTVPRHYFSTGVVKFSDILHSDATIGTVKAGRLINEARYLNNQQKIIAFVELNKDYMTDHLVGQLVTNLVEYQVVLDEDFNKSAAPILAHYISMMNREHALAFGRCFKNFALLEIQSPEIWKALLSVFYREKMHRYMTIPDLSESFVYFGNWEVPPYNLMNLIAPIIKKHEMRIPDRFADPASEIYEKLVSSKVEDHSFLDVIDLEMKTIAQ